MIGSLPMTEVVEIPEDYYLTNSQSLLDFVAQQYDDLLEDDERSFLSSFQSALYILMILAHSSKSPCIVKECIVQLLGE